MSTDTILRMVQLGTVRRLLKPAQDIADTMTARKLDLLHVAIGVVGEVIELRTGLQNKDHENVLEEAGDILFYGNGVEIVLNAVGPHSQIEEPGSTPLAWADQMLYHAGEILDLVKKHAIFNKQPLAAGQILAHLNHVYENLRPLLLAYGYTLDDARRHNIAKLEKRHSSGVYSDAGQNGRADKA